MTLRALRVALVAPLVAPITEPFLGGSQALVSDLAAELAVRGHAVTLFGADGSRVPGVEIITLGIDADALPPAIFAGATCPDPAMVERERVAFLRIAYEVRRRASEFDVVHNHAFDAPAFELLGEAHPRIVHTIHLPPVLPAVTRAAAHAAPGSTMVSVSAFMAQAWESLVGATHIIRNGVPVDRIPFGAEPGATWLFVGRIAAEKGLEDALTVAEGAGRRLRVIGGVYDAAYHARLASRLERHDQVGPLPRPEVFQEMARAQGILMPARWDEPFGLTAVEAMAAGTPVAAYARGALPEVIAERIGGFLVTPGDTDGLGRAASRFASIERKGCRDWARSHFDLAQMVDGYVRLYRELA
jgi:UDP-glucose:tetrahydrobiopterin glucosyltransferase